MGVICRVEGREGSSVSAGHLWSCRYPEGHGMGEKHTLTSPKPPRSPQALPTESEIIHFHKYLCISAIGNQHGVPEHWPNRENGSRGDKCQTPTTQNNPVSQKTTLAQGFPAWKQPLRWQHPASPAGLPTVPPAFRGRAGPTQASSEPPAPQIQTSVALD